MNIFYARLSLVGALLFGASFNYATVFNRSDIEIISPQNNSITIWDGNIWSNGFPDSESEVVITGDLVLTESIHVKKMTVEATGSVLITTGINLIITNELINNSTANNFVVEHNANLIQINQTQNIGAITVKRNSREMVRNDMAFWSSPVSGQIIRQFSPETLFNRFWRYNESNDEFYQILTSDNDQSLFETGLGYSIRVRNTLATNSTTEHNGSFVGTPFNGILQVPVQKNYNGFNLVGNPYASDIDLEKFFNINPQVRAILLWSHKFPVGHPDYSNNYEFITRGGSENIIHDRLKVGEGFLVLIDENNVTPVVFNNDMRIVEITQKNRFFLQLSDSNRINNQISVSYVENATRDFDQLYDRRIPNTLNTGIYTIVGVSKLMIDARDLEFDTEEVIKLGFKTAEEGEYTLSLAGLEGMFSDNHTIYIKDYETRTLHNLSQGNYRFNANIGEFNERFEIVFEESEFLSASDVKQENSIQTYKFNDQTVVKSTREKIKTLDIISIDGRVIETKDNINKNQFEFNMFLKGVYLLKITTSDGKTTIKKITN